MGTKIAPGKFDCYKKANQDEPMFTLLARDPAASHLVVMWACIRNGDTEGALQEFNSIVQDIGPTYAEFPEKPEKIAEAIAVAEAMEAWRELGLSD
jgi:hypothetical protein